MEGEGMKGIKEAVMSVAKSVGSGTAGLSGAKREGVGSAMSGAEKGICSWLGSHCGN